MRTTARVAMGCALLAMACGGRQRPASAPGAPVAASMRPAKAVPVCSLPKQVALSQRADDYESSRVLIVNVSSHEVVWHGPTGSGNHPAAWSHDGSMLAYTLGEDLIVHRDTGPDRLVYRGLDSEHALYAFSPDDRSVAVVGGDGVAVVDLTRPGTMNGPAVDTGIACLPERMLWTMDATRLVVSCGGDEQVQVWSAVQRNVTQYEVEGVTSLLGWLPGQQDMMVAQADGAVIAISIDGARRHRLRSERQDELFVTAYVQGAGLLEYSDYAPEDGAPRTIWLAPAPPVAVSLPAAPPPIGSTPPLAWIDGPIFDLGYSPDGAWAAFATAVDSMDESGDVYLARVGDSKVTMVIQMPRPAADGADSDSYDDDDDDDDDDDGDDAVYYVGYAAPTPRPEPGSRCHAASAPSPLLQIARVLGDSEELSLYPGVIVAPLESGNVNVLYGDSLAAIERPAVEAALGLADGSLLLAEPAGVQLIGGDGQQRATLPPMDFDTIAAAPGGGFSVLRDARTVELFDAAGARTGVYSAPSDISERSPMIGGGAVVTLAGGEVVTIDATGKRRASFQLGAIRKVVALSTDLLVHAEPGADEDADEYGEYDEYAEEWVNLVFESPAGKILGHHRTVSPDSESSVLVPLGNGSLAALSGSERTKLHLLDSRARLKGSFKIGTYSETPPLVLDEGAIVVRGGYHDLYVVDGRGRYLAGISLDEEIYEGPVRMGPQTFAVQTDSRVLILRRPTR